MIMPCMNSTSAPKGAWAGVQTVVSLRNLPGWPGAPGCTMGADCCAGAAIAPSKKRAAIEKSTAKSHALLYNPRYAGATAGKNSSSF